MKYLFIAYLLFQCLFDHWGDNSVNGRVIYFAFQYGWIGALSLYVAVNSRDGLYYIMTLIMLIITINELTLWNSNETTYAMMVSPPLAFGLTVLVIVSFAFLIILKHIKWNGQKKHGRQFS